MLYWIIVESWGIAGWVLHVESESHHCGKQGTFIVDVSTDEVVIVGHYWFRCRKSEEAQDSMQDSAAERAKKLKFDARQHRNDKLKDRDTIHNERTPNEEVKVMTEPNKRWAPGGLRACKQVREAPGPFGHWTE